ncbi:ArsR family transcriptional regulator [Streptomyces sp. NPDC101194]|uniref:ArsR/SmtB family transcription factor n=1 Tax=Streptomyces sp. NPDC101194 TaxID=3366127 RepID=UPI003804BDCB
MLRIHFTSEDLARTRVLTTWGPLGETLLSLTTLRQSNTEALFGGWRRRVSRVSEASAHPASTLFCGGALDLFTLTGPAPSLEEGLEALRAARPDHVRDELAGAFAAFSRYAGRTTPWAGTPWADLPHDRAVRQELVRFLHDYHRVAVAPHWSRIQSRLQSEQTAHARILASSGVEAMLAGLPPGFRWRSPVLEIGRGALTGEVTLGGRGLALVPSAFSRTRPITYSSVMDDQAPLVLFVPVIRSVSDSADMLTGPGNGTHRALAALLGRTRAQALDAISHAPCTTGQLAELLSVSPATSSEHATVLRQSGLISTTRHGSTVVHAVTPLGSAMLNGRPNPTVPA